MPISYAGFLKKYDPMEGTLRSTEFRQIEDAISDGLYAFKDDADFGYKMRVNHGFSNNTGIVGGAMRSLQQGHKQMFEYFNLDEAKWQEKIKEYVDNINTLLEPTNYAILQTYLTEESTSGPDPTDYYVNDTANKKAAYGKFLNNFEKFINALNKEFDAGIDTSKLAEGKKLYEAEKKYQEDKKIYEKSIEDIPTAAANLYKKHRGDFTGIFSGASPKMDDLRKAYERYKRCKESPMSEEFDSGKYTMTMVLNDLKNAADAYIQDKKYDKNGNEKSDPSSTMGTERLAAARKISELAGAAIEASASVKKIVQGVEVAKKPPLKEVLEAQASAEALAPKKKEIPKKEEKLEEQEIPKKEEKKKEQEIPEFEPINVEQRRRTISNNAGDEFVREKLASLEEKKEAFRKKAAETILRGYHKTQMDAFFNENPSLTEEQMKEVRASNKVEDYVAQSMEALLGSKDFKGFMDSIDTEQKLADHKTRAQNPDVFYMYFKQGEHLKKAQPMEEIVQNRVMSDVITKAMPTKAFNDLVEKVNQSGNGVFEINLDDDLISVDLDREIDAAQYNLFYESTQSKGSYPNLNNESVKKGYATLIAAQTILEEQKKGKHLNMGTEAFQESVDDVVKSEPFKAMMKKYKDDGMFLRATADRGQTLYASMQQANLDYQKHLKNQKMGKGKNVNVDKTIDKNIAQAPVVKKNMKNK